MKSDSSLVNTFVTTGKKRQGKFVTLDEAIYLLLKAEVRKKVV